MDNIRNRTWICCINEMSSKYFMPIMAILLISYNTVVNLWIDGKVETIQNVVAMVILGIVGCNLLFSSETNLISWMKRNIIVGIYFIVRFCSLWESGFDYSVLRTIFFEMFFLIGITSFTIGGMKEIYKLLKLFAYSILVLSVGSISLFLLSLNISGEFQKILETYTYIEKSGIALLFTNTNSAGIMTGFAIIVGFILYREKIFGRNFAAVYCLYNIIALFVYGCRSADIGIFVSIVVFLIVNNYFQNKKKEFVCFCLVVFLLSIIPIYIFIEKQYEGNYYCLNEKEILVNDLSTNRYSIWKECYIIQKEKPILGYGSLKLEQENRRELIDNIDKEYYYNLDPNNFFRFPQATEFGPHNGYISMSLGTGFGGLIIFAGILLYRIKKSAIIGDGNWYLLLIYIFSINCFESLFILNRFFACFYMFILLESMGANKKEEV